MDSPILTDLNNLPLIPGTSLAGVFRKSAVEKIKDGEGNDIFGYAADDSSSNHSEGGGSRIIFSHGVIIDKKGSPVINILDDIGDFLSLIVFDRLPVRERNAVTGKGVTKKHSKFDEQIIPKGVRFVFEIEFKGNCDNEKDRKIWSDIIGIIKSDNFRLGGGSRHGFGLVKLLNYKENIYRLNIQKELEDYLDREFLAGSKEIFESYENTLRNNNEIILNGEGTEVKVFKEYRLKLKPIDFFIFSSGFNSEDTDADMSPLKEIAITYNTDKADKMYYVMPASSIKGAISHKIAYHYNFIKGNFIENYGNEKHEIENLASPQNRACKILFGSKKEKNDKSENYAGSAFFEDIFIEENRCKTVQLQHVSIDRFTGKSIDGALFSEEVLQLSKNSEINIRFFVKKDVIDSDKDIEIALERTIFDIENGLLPLGGGVNRGHGTFIKAE
jgi:CRISPR/Cas system CSM-associated protein Csm3 (group 7 of RAMP superfamily)